MFGSLISLFVFLLHGNSTRITPQPTAPGHLPALGTIRAMDDCTTSASSTCRTDGSNKP